MGSYCPQCHHMDGDHAEGCGEPMTDPKPDAPTEEAVAVVKALDPSRLRSEEHQRWCKLIDRHTHLKQYKAVAEAALDEHADEMGEAAMLGPGACAVCDALADLQRSSARNGPGRGTSERPRW